MARKEISNKIRESFLHYQTTPLWIIATMITAVAAIKLGQKRPGSLRISASWALPLFCFVVHFAFDMVVYGNGLVRLQTETILPRSGRPLIFTAKIWPMMDNFGGIP